MLVRPLVLILFVILSILALVLYAAGLDRSLWLDEAWVANSLLAPTLLQTWYYDAWLQTTPPLFLAVARLLVTSTGPSNASFRILPLVMSIVAAGFAYFLFRRRLRQPFSLVVFSLLLFAPLAIEFAHELKQYSTELAVTVALLFCTSRYLDRPSAGRFAGLCGAALLGLGFAYSTAFLLPGIALAIFLASPGERRLALVRSGVFGFLGCAVFGLEYQFLIVPNVGPALQKYFGYGTELEPIGRHLMLRTGDILLQSPVPGLALLSRRAAAVVAVALPALPFLFLLWRRRSLKSLALPLACVLPCVLVIGANYVHRYPMAPRLLLFLLPGFFLAVGLGLQSVFLLTPRKAFYLALLLALIPPAVAIEVWMRFGPPPVREDLANAVDFLIENARKDDVIYVHASVAEGFRLYTRMRQVSDLNVRLGSTGSPCCPRADASAGVKASPRTLFEDWHRKMGAQPPPKLWLFATARLDHWRLVGFDESKLILKYLIGQKCIGQNIPRFEGVVLVSVSCPAAP